MKRMYALAYSILIAAGLMLGALSAFTLIDRASTPEIGYTVTFSLGDIAVDNEADFSPLTVTGGSLSPTDIKTPTAYNARFDGWYYQGTDTPLDVSAPISADITLEARWTKLYWISFNTNGGERIEPYQVLDGTIISEPEIPYHSGHYFVGWYSKVDEFTLGEHDFTKPVTGNIKLEAKWIVRDSNLVYDDQTHIKLILPSEYTSTSMQYINELKSSLDEHLIYDSEIVSASEHTMTAKYREIVIGRSDREISKNAYNQLNKINNYGGRYLRYIVYAERVMVARGVFELSVCIAYDEDENGLAMRLAIEAFINNFSRDKLLLSTGVRLRKIFNPQSYLSQTATTAPYAIIDLCKREGI